MLCTRTKIEKENCWQIHQFKIFHFLDCKPAAVKRSIAIRKSTINPSKLNHQEKMWNRQHHPPFFRELVIGLQKVEACSQKDAKHSQTFQSRSVPSSTSFPTVSHRNKVTIHLLHLLLFFKYPRRHQCFPTVVPTQNRCRNIFR